MITFIEVGDAIEKVLQEYWDSERLDFETTLQDPEGNLTDHTFLHLLTLHNVQRVLSGDPEHTLQDVIEEINAPVYLCQDCGRLSTQIEPIPERVFASFEPGDIVPAGCCLRCGAVVHPV